MILLEEFEKNVQVVIKHLDKCAEEISQLYVVKDWHLIGKPNAGRKAYHALNLHLTVSSPPEQQLQDMLKWLVRDLPNVKVELENQYYDIVRNSVDIAKVSDEVVLGKQLNSLELKIKKLSTDLSYYVVMAIEANRQNETQKPTENSSDDVGDIGKYKKKLNPPPKIIEYSKPLFNKQWAYIFDVSPNMMRKLRIRKQYHFRNVSKRKWILPKDELPAEYLEKYRSTTS